MSDDELKANAISWLSDQVAAFFDEGIGKLVPCYDRCLNQNGDYVEM